MTSTSEKSLHGLELLRFLSAVGVVFWHYQHFFIRAGTEPPAGFSRAEQPLYPMLSFLYEYGHLSVSLFWLISGYIFFWKYHRAVHAGAVGGWAFFVMRFSRLYPLHVATLIAVALLQIAFRASHDGADFAFQPNDWPHFALHLAFASNWGFESGLTFNGPIWSVSREVVIYAVFFAVSRAVSTAVLGRVVLVGLAGALWLANDRFLGDGSLRVFLTVAVYFFMGGLIEAVAAAVPARWLKLAAPAALLAAIALVLVLFRPGDATPKAVILAATSATLVGFLGLEHWDFARRPLARLAPLADLTYSSYLLHFPVQLVAVLAVDQFGLGRDLFLNPLALLAFLLATFGLGRVAFDRFERPAQALLRRWMLAPRAAGAPSKA